MAKSLAISVSVTNHESQGLFIKKVQIQIDREKEGD